MRFFFFHFVLFANVSFVLAFSTLLLCCSSLRWLCFLVSIHLYLCCALYFSFSCFSFFFFAVFSLGVTKTQIKSQISQILIVNFCFGVCIPTLSLGPDNNPTRPGEELLKKCFCCLASWSISNVLKYLFLLCFYTSSKFCLQNGPQ